MDGEVLCLSQQGGKLCGADLLMLDQLHLCPRIPVAPSVPCADSLPDGLCGLSSLEVNVPLFPEWENELSACNFQACFFGEVWSTFFHLGDALLPSCTKQKEQQSW